MKFCSFLAVFIFLSACTSNQPKDSLSASENLYKFAQANCLFWYFNEKGYDSNQIRKISGGFAELGTSSPEKYQSIALYLKEHPGLENSKQTIDAKLNLCFNLESDKGLREIIR